MIMITERRGLGKFFKGVYGSPKTKGEMAKKILLENNLKGSEVLFVGDATSDFYGAKENDIRFIGRVHDIYPNPFLNFGVKDTVRDIEQLEILLKKENLLPINTHANS